LRRKKPKCGTSSSSNHFFASRWYGPADSNSRISTGSSGSLSKYIACSACAAAMIVWSR